MWFLETRNMRWQNVIFLLHLVFVASIPAVSPTTLPPEAQDPIIWETFRINHHQSSTTIEPPKVEPEPVMAFIKMFGVAIVSCAFIIVSADYLWKQFRQENTQAHYALCILVAIDLFNVAAHVLYYLSFMMGINFYFCAIVQFVKSFCFYAFDCQLSVSARLLFKNIINTNDSSKLKGLTVVVVVLSIFMGICETALKLSYNYCENFSVLFFKYHTNIQPFIMGFPVIPTIYYLFRSFSIVYRSDPVSDIRERHYRLVLIFIVAFLFYIGFWAPFMVTAIFFHHGNIGLLHIYSVVGFLRSILMQILLRFSKFVSLAPTEGFPLNEMPQLVTSHSPRLRNSALTDGCDIPQPAEPTEIAESADADEMADVDDTSDNTQINQEPHSILLGLTDVVLTCIDMG